jgi:hypothetical protein
VEHYWSWSSFPSYRKEAYAVDVFVGVDHNNFVRRLGGWNTNYLANNTHSATVVVVVVVDDVVAYGTEEREAYSYFGDDLEVVDTSLVAVVHTCLLQEVPQEVLREVLQEVVDHTMHLNQEEAWVQR